MGPAADYANYADADLQAVRAEPQLCIRVICVIRGWFPSSCRLDSTKSF
jgi:hypothetical protein